MKRGHFFHLHLFNADDPECGRCHSNSSLFEIAQPGYNASGDPSATDGNTASVSAAPGDDATTAQSQQLPLGLGLGLVLGLPLVVLLTAEATLLHLRRKRRGRKDVANQQGEMLVENKGVNPAQETIKTEVQGQSVVELSGVEHVVEAPNKTDISELQGSPA